MKKNATVEDFLNKICLEHELAPTEHFLRVKKKKEMPDSKFFVPQRSDLLDSYVSFPKVGEYRVEASGSWPVRIAKHT